MRVSCLIDVKNEVFVEEHEILAIHIHPNYSYPFIDFDIALLQIERPMEYSPLIRPICLPPKELPQDSSLYKANELAWVIGWSYQVEHGAQVKKAKIYETPRVVELDILSRERCLEHMGPSSMFLTNRLFCAGVGEEKIGTCIMSTGGPLMQKQLSPEGDYLYWTQVGIVMSDTCSREGSIVFNTLLQKFVPWIEETIERALSKTK